MGASDFINHSMRESIKIMSEKPLKLLYGVKSLAHGLGGAEKVLTTVAKDMADQGHDVTLISFDSVDEKSFYPLDSKIIYKPLGIGNTAHKSGIYETTKRIIALRKFINKNKPDIAIGFMHSMFAPLSIALLGTGVPLLASEHIVLEHYKSRRIEYVFMNIALLLSKKIIVLSNHMKQQYPAFFQRKVEIIPNPVVLSKFIPMDSPERTKTVLNVGRLEHQKNQEALIRAFASIESEFPDWSLEIIGEGSLRKDLEQLSKKLGLGHRISLPGTTNNIAQHYQRASLFVLPSTYESFGLVTIEAMSAGLPCIGMKNCAGTNEIIDHNENGILVSGNNEQEEVHNLANAMTALMKSPKKRETLGNAAREHSKKFAAQDIYLLWEKLFRRCV